MLIAKIDGAIRLVMVKFLSGIFPLYIVNEHPKSGGTWLGLMLSDASGLPFPRNEMPPFKSCVMKGHYFNSWGMKNVVVVWRDGRDVIISLYHQSLFLNEGEYNRNLVKKTRKDLDFKDYMNLKENLPRFIQYILNTKRYDWPSFVRHWHSQNRVVYVKYEQLRANCAQELRRIFSELTNKELLEDRARAIEEKYSFEQLSKRKPGQEDKHSFFRKGIVGDWRNYFTKEASEVFDRIAGKELILLGYEKDNSWVQGVL